MLRAFTSPTSAAQITAGDDSALEYDDFKV